MAKYRTYNERVIDAETGVTVWAGDALDVVGMLQRIEELEADLAEAIEQRDQSVQSATAWRKEYRQVGQLFDEARQRVRDLEQIVDAKNAVIVSTAEDLAYCKGDFSGVMSNYLEEKRRREEDAPETAAGLRNHRCYLGLDFGNGL